jgi:hypothetical protein
MVKKNPRAKRGTSSTSEPPNRLSIAAAVRRASEQIPPDENDDQYLQNASVAARALQLLLPDENIDEDDVEFGVAFRWPNVPSPIKLVRSYLEGNGLLNGLVGGAPDTPSESPAQPFVYGVVDGELIVLPKVEAMKWARLTRALNTCSTWGELKSAAPSDLYREAVEILGRQRMPATRVLSSDFEELAEEGFPPSVGQIVKRHLPAELDHLFEMAYSALGQELPQLPEEVLPQVLLALSSVGARCLEDQALVAAAAGFESGWSGELPQ